MANYPSKINVPIAITSRSKVNLSGRHRTTSNFMELSVARIIPMVPGQSLNAQYLGFTRLEPMPVPTFGDAVMNARAFFVPFRTIFPAWNDFIEDVAHVYSGGLLGHVEKVHTIKNSTFVNFLTSAECATLDATVATAAEVGPNRDIVTYKSTNDGYRYLCYTLTPFGKRSLKLLMQLGYGFNFDLTTPDIEHSAFQLLALAKVYFDWYYPQQYTQDLRAMRIQSWFKQDNIQAPNTSFLLEDDLSLLFNTVSTVCYNSDYFVSAWDNPVAPNSGSYSTVTIKDPTTENNNAAVETEANGTPSAKWSFNLTQFADDALHALTDYMKRHQLAGARVLDRYLARFGVTLPAEKLNRSVYIDSYTTPVDFGDVTSTTDTFNEETGTGAQLASYAGKGVGIQRDVDFSYSTDEHGFFIVCSSIVPISTCYQGADRSTMHISRLDFWTPEFDNLGVQALSKRELFMPLNVTDMRSADGNSPAVNYNTAVFGFVPRYSEYKRGFDQITGDYRLGSLNTGKDAWTLARDLTPYIKSVGLGNAYHDENFVRGVDADQYNRIFYVTDNTVDHFNVEHMFNIVSSFPGKSLYDDYEFDNEDKARKVGINIGGQKAN